MPSYTSKRGEPIAAKRGRAKGRQKEESHQNLPTFAAKNLSTYGPHPEIARVPSQLEHNNEYISNYIFRQD